MQNSAAVMSDGAESALKQVARGDLGLNCYFGMNDEQIETIASFGHALMKQGQFDDAEDIFKGLVAFEPKSFYGFAGLGAIQLHQSYELEGEELDAVLVSAEENLRKATELAPNEATPYANLFEVLLKQARLKEAADTFQKAYALDPELNDPGVNRAAAIVHALKLIISEAQKAGIRN